MLYEVITVDDLGSVLAGAAGSGLVAARDAGNGLRLSGSWSALVGATAVAAIGCHSHAG